MLVSEIEPSQSPPVLAFYVLEDWCCLKVPTYQVRPPFQAGLEEDHRLGRKVTAKIGNLNVGKIGKSMRTYSLSEPKILLAVG